MCSLATISTIYLIQLNLLPTLAANQWLIGIELAISFGYLVYTFFKKSLQTSLALPFKDEFRITNLLIVTGITFLVVFTASTSAPLNWDSNAYNVARISTMLGDSSSILDPSTASARQAIYSIGHDILLYPDITFGIMRGLPMVSLLEFFVLLGTLLALSKTIGKTALADRPKALKAIGLITTILLFNSHQQVMQALITKNDLAITLLFTISIFAGIFCLHKQEKSFSDKLALCAIILMLCVAINMKSYGIILLIPTGLTATIVITKRLFYGQTKKLDPDSNNANSFLRVLLILSISTLISLSIQTSLVHQAWLGAPSSRIDSITSAWTNQKGSWSNRIENSFLNAGRILLQGSLFPYTTLKPYLPIGTELQSPINDSIIPKALQGSKGSASGPFGLLYGTNPDMAYPFLGFQMGLALGLIGWFLNRPLNGLLGRLYILISSGLAFFFFSTALLYQPWISRFMGPVYIPLIPLAAVGSCLLIQRLSVPYSSCQLKEFRRRISQTTAFLLGILPLISSMSLTGYLSRRAGMPQGKSDFYHQYLLSQAGLSKQKANQLIKDLKSRNFEYRYLCSSDGLWTLTAMILSQENQSFRGHNVRLISIDECQQAINKLEKTGEQSSQLGPGQSIHLHGKEFISLP